MPSSEIVELHVPCPVCPSSDAYCVWADGHGHCFSCNYHFTPNGLGNTLDYTFEYLPWRGVSADTYRLYDVKTKIDAEGKPLELGYPWPNGAIQVRNLQAKDFRWKHNDQGDAGKGLFGKDKFAHSGHKSLTITEGAQDACSLYEVLKSPVVSVQSASSAVRDISVDWDFVSAFERVYLAFDTDSPGLDATRSVARLFPYGRVFHVKLNPRKDANDWIRTDQGLGAEPHTLRQIWQSAKPYLPDKIITGFDEFAKLLKEEPKRGIPYPFPTLTEMTYGIRTGESVLIKAQEKVGKTSLMHAIEYNILKENPDARVGAFFLEEPSRRHLQSLAGIHLKTPVHLPESGVGSDEVNSALAELLKGDERLFLYNHFGNDDPDSFLDAVRYLVTGMGVRYVLLDHIGMVSVGSGGEADERRLIEYLATKLEMLVKELDFALLFVSHVNDFGQTRNSHYLTKIADITIDARRDTLSVDPVERNTIHLSIPFNRYCHCTGHAGDILFDPTTYCYREVQALEASNDNWQTEIANVNRWAS